MCSFTSVASVRALLVGMVYCILLVQNGLIVKSFQSTRQDSDWAEITRLYGVGWTKIEERNFGDSESNFRKATRKLEHYRSLYIKDQNSLSFLRATYMLGTFSELGNRDQEAQKYYEQTLRHPLVHSSETTAEVKLITQYAKKRLSVIKQRLQRPAVPPRKDYPRISIKGGSKGARDLPEREALFRP